jgi:hypothetical protein
MKGRPSHLAAAFQLPAADRAACEHLLRQTTIPAGVAQRARVLLAITPDTSITRVAARCGLSRNRVYKWLHRYLAQGIAGLYDQPRPGRPRTRSAQDV